MNFDLTPTPHQEAADIIAGKAPVVGRVFKGLLPELRGRAFTVTGLQGLDVLQRVRDEIAALPRGSTWDDVKANIADTLEAESFSGAAAERRAELLLRTHGFQAFQASNWRVAQEDPDTTHLQYLATEDSHVRETHLALNGMVIPKDDPFWDAHYPPWEWGCRCRVRPMNPDLVDQQKAADAEMIAQGGPPENALVPTGPTLQGLRDGRLQRDGQAFDVTPPRDQRQDGRDAFQWQPDDLRLPIGEVLLRYDPEIRGDFVAWAKGTDLGTGTAAGPGNTTVWNWLMSRPAPRRSAAEAARAAVRTGRRQGERTPVTHQTESGNR